VLLQPGGGLYKRLRVQAQDIQGDEDIDFDGAKALDRMGDP
jgi:hypothetical protein